MARLNERLSIVEEALNKIGKLDELKQRLLTLEKNLYLSKKVLTFEEACSYNGYISDTCSDSNPRCEPKL